MESLMPDAPLAPGQFRLFINEDGSYDSNTTPSPSESSQKDFRRLGPIQLWEANGTHWSGTRHKFDVNYNNLPLSLRAQLKKVGNLGRGRYGSVHKVVYKGVALARKSIKLDTLISRDLLESLQCESSIGEKLQGHSHIIKVVGTYWKGPSNLNILTFPVAECDLGQFLDDCDKWWTAGSNPTFAPDEAVRDRFRALGFRNEFSEEEPKRRLLEIMGCITSAMVWMHKQGIQHRDLKPANILLRAADVYLTDFGISRDTTKTARSTTDHHLGFSYGYSSPEVLDGDWYNAEKADVYSLGCVFLHILTMVYESGSRRTMAPLYDNRDYDREQRFQQHMLLNNTHPSIPYPLTQMLQQLLSVDRTIRPNMVQVNVALQQFGASHGTFHGLCCFNSTCQNNFKASVARLTAWEEQGEEWSGIGQRYDVDYKSLSWEYQQSLDKAVLANAGGCYSYRRYEVCYRGVPLAVMPEQIYHGRRNDGKVKAFIPQEFGQHHHILKLVGTYWDNSTLNKLTYPVASSDLESFLKACDIMIQPLRSTLLTHEQIRFSCARLGFEDPLELQDPAPRLRQIMGCLAKGLAWLHSKGIYHCNLNAFCVRLPPDGISITNFQQPGYRIPVKGSPGYYRGSAGNLAVFEGTGLDKIDVWSLGCIFLHILTVIHAPPHMEATQTLMDEFCEFLSNTSTAPHPWMPPDFVILLKGMMATNRSDRPDMDEVDRRLCEMGGGEGIFHGRCCLFRP